MHYPFPLSFDDLRPKLLLHEQCIKSSKEGLDSSAHHALVAIQLSGSSTLSTKNNSGGPSKGKRNKNKGGNNGGRNNNNHGDGGNNNARDSGNNNNDTDQGRRNGMIKHSKLLFSSMPCIAFITMACPQQEILRKVAI